MKKKITLSFIICLCFLLLIGGLSLEKIFANSDKGFYVKNHGIQNTVKKPSSFSEGQVWIDKDIKDNNDGNFIITLSAAAKGYKSQSKVDAALQPNSMVVISDVIGDGFKVSGTLPEGVVQSGNTLTWSMKANQLPIEGTVKSVSFKVINNANKAGMFYTNASANAEFTPAEGNPYYYIENTDINAKDKDVQAKIHTVPKKDYTWKDAKVTMVLKASGFVEMAEKKTVATKQPVNTTKDIPDNSNHTNIVPYTKAGPLLPKTDSVKKTRSVLPPASDLVNSDGLETSKKAAYDTASGLVNLEMTAYATGKVASVPSPADIILVLDQSGSMAFSMDASKDGIPYEKTYDFSAGPFHVKIDDKYYGVTHTTYPYDRWYYLVYKDGNSSTVDFIPKTSEADQNPNHLQVYKYVFKNPYTYERLNALKGAVGKFITSVEKDAKERNVDHRLAVVGFSDGTSNEILSVAGNNSGAAGSGKVGVSYDKLEDKHYKEALQPVNKESGISILRQAVNALDAKGATNTNKGMEMANKILEQDKEDHNKIVIVFTDGAPTTVDKFENSVANGALKTSYDIKTTYGATTYTIGVVDDANPELPIKSGAPALPAGGTETESSEQINKFLHQLSSNYIDETAQNMDRIIPENEKNPQNNGYYLAASNTDELNEIFINIYDQIQPAIVLDGTTVLKDIVTDTFSPITNNQVKVYKQSASNPASLTELSEKDGVLINVDTSGKTVRVTGFDYSNAANLVYEKDGVLMGNKLVVKIINIKPIDGFIGGNQIKTNDNSSGIYSKNQILMEHFNRPVVDIPILYDIKPQNQTIYIGDHQNFILNFLKNGENITYLQNGKSYKIDGINNRMVNISYKILYEDKAVANYDIPAGSKTGNVVGDINVDSMTYKKDDEHFTIKVEVVPVYKGTYPKYNVADKDVILYILKPIINVSDESIFYGEKTKLVDRIGQEIVWKCNVTGDIPVPITKKPELQFQIKDLNKNKILTDLTQELELRKDTQYKLIVNRQDNKLDITDVSKIQNKGTKKDFMIYVITGQLEITKTIDEQYTDKTPINANQSFVFKITRKETKTGNPVDTFYQTISFSANEKKNSQNIVLQDLKKGYYTVTEVNDWSWKYQLENSSSNAAHHLVSDIFIGEKINDTYFGSAQHGDLTANPALLTFNNKVNANFANILGDVASAINRFIGK